MGTRRCSRPRRGNSALRRAAAAWCPTSPAENADPDTGYEIYYGGAAQVVGGTSAVAPLYAGFIAACGKKLGNLLPKLWGSEASFHDITAGDNGMYKAVPGPDACTGLGSPIGEKLAALLVATAQPVPVPTPVPAPTPTPAPGDLPTLAQVESWATEKLAKLQPVCKRSDALKAVKAALATHAASFAK